MDKNQLKARKMVQFRRTQSLRGTKKISELARSRILVPENERQGTGCGLVNYKNNCFFNAILQAFFHCPAIVRFLKEHKKDHVECVTCCLRDTLAETQRKKKSFVPLKLYDLLKGKIANLLNGEQQDSHEFFLKLVEIMESIQHVVSSCTYPFYGEITSTVICSECGYQSDTTTPFTTIPIKILGGGCVNDSLMKFFTVENVTYKCDCCKRKVNATKKFLIAQAPKILCLELKCFQRSKKITNSMDIMKEIEISQHLVHKQCKVKYDLKAIVNHKGNNLNSGHYTTIATTEALTCPWNEFDDSHIYRIPKINSKITSSEAYILFYEVSENEDTFDDCELGTPIEIIDDADDRESWTLIEIVDDTETETEVPKNTFMRPSDDCEMFTPVEIIDDDDDDDMDTAGPQNDTSGDTPIEAVNADDRDLWTLIEIVDDTEIETEKPQDTFMGTFDDCETWTPAEIIDDDDDDDDDMDTVRPPNVCLKPETESRSAGIFNENEPETEFRSTGVFNENEDLNRIADENDSKLSGRRIVDISYIFEQMQKMNSNVCKKCNNGEMEFEREFKKGLLSTFFFRCTSCETTARIDSCPPKNDFASINESAVLGIVSIGLGFYHLEEFLAHMDVSCMCYSTFHKLDTKLQADWWKLAKQCEADALNEEIRLAIENNQVDSAGNALIEGEIDGSWCKRSFGNNFSSLSGCAAIIGRRTKKIIYSGVKNKYCHICKIAESKDITPRIHECKTNYVGHSAGMETEIILDGFKFLNEKGLRISKLVGDGDSSTYKAITDMKLYKNPDMDTEKFECENHVYKNFNKKCGTLHLNKKLMLRGRKLLPQNIGKNISRGVRMAAKHWRETDIDPAEKYINLEKDIMNAPLHYFGIHDDCADYFCSKESDPEAYGLVDVLKESDVYYELLDICQYYLSNNAKSLIAGLTTNKTEGFNSLICKTLGGKRICNSLDGNSYKSRTAIADVQYNTKGHSGSTFHEHTFGKTMDSCIKMENTRKRKVAKNAISKEIKSKKAKLDEKPKKDVVKAKHYGVGHQEVDMTESAIEVAKDRFLKRLQDNQANRNAIVLETRAQRHSFKWMQIRRNMLTSSYFGRILKVNNRKSFTKIFEEIIHKNVQYSNTAELRHQRLYQIEALSIFSGIYGSESISTCGIFIDPEFCFLGASPFRLFGEDGIVAVKCPKKAFRKSMKEAVNKNLIQLWTGPFHDRRVNVKSHWYFEIQGQLHVTRRRVAHLVIYLGESVYEIVELERNETFWKEKMEKELLFFYNEGLLKELVDPRYDRGMDLRKYDSEKKTFS